MSDMLAVQPEGRLQSSVSLSWRLSWPLRRVLAALRRRLRDYRLHRQTQILLLRLDRRLLHDIGIEPIDLIVPPRQRPPAYPWLDPTSRR
jgi:uncharacterized protein YjiS (DUF1127 family)